VAEGVGGLVEGVGWCDVSGGAALNYHGGGGGEH